MNRFNIEDDLLIESSSCKHCNGHSVAENEQGVLCHCLKKYKDVVVGASPTQCGSSCAVRAIREAY